MTPRERLLTVLKGGIPDRVPVTPDLSNMIPCRLTGRPFWDVYLYNDPPIYEAFITAAKHFNLDSLMLGNFNLAFPGDAAPGGRPAGRFIVRRDAEMIVTQYAYTDGAAPEWHPTVQVFRVADSPVWGVAPSKIGLPEIPAEYEPLEGVKPSRTDPPNSPA